MPPPVAGADVCGVAVPEPLFDVMLLPLGDTSHHNPPRLFRPWPLVMPGAVSPVNRYSGWPKYVTCLVPSFRLLVLRLAAFTPGPAVGLPVATSGGQTAAHAP